MICIAVDTAECRRHTGLLLQRVSFPPNANQFLHAFMSITRVRPTPQITTDSGQVRGGVAE